MFYFTITVYFIDVCMLLNISMCLFVRTICILLNMYPFIDDIMLTGIYQVLKSISDDTHTEKYVKKYDTKFSLMYTYSAQNAL